jgi:CDP-diacylglycerol--glycerol-3-phosphate 3-phosphatidyltransferase
MAFFSAGRVNPNWITFTGLLLIAVAGYFLLDGKYYHALGFIIMGGVFDYVDGKVAASTGRITLFGGIFDSVLDRYSDMIIYLALAVHLHRDGHALSALIAIFALIGAFMTSYIKAVGKSHGLDFRAGFLRRQERITIICVVLGFSSLDSTMRGWLGSYSIAANISSPNLVVIFGIWFLAVFSNVTALQRLLTLKRMVGRPEDNGNDKAI